MKRKKRKVALLCIAAIFLVLLVWSLWGNTALQLNTFEISGDRLPDSFDGYRIAQVSDLHNAQLGKGNEKLLNMLREAKPDIVVITGDLIDSRNTNIAVALQFVEQALRIAPCYYVTGNHEARVAEYAQLRQKMLDLGVVVLEDDTIELSCGQDTISLIGVNDPSFETDYLKGDSATVTENKLRHLADGETYTVLLSHRPELFEVYADSGVDLVLSGHAHGGQFRLPFVGGVFAPNQGFFPAYDEGLYKEGNTHMIVSRGIGNSAFPLRFNNRPEIVLIELKTK